MTMTDAWDLAAVKYKLAFPLDVQTSSEALDWVRELADLVGWFKVGLELFIAEGPSLISELKKFAPEAKIFLDLKLHDIPATIAGAVRSAEAWGVSLLSVHAQGGREMMRKASEAAQKVRLLAVTVLTSLNPEEDFPELRPKYTVPGAYAVSLAKRAREAGVGGLVASPLEIKALRKELGPDVFLLIPGIRPKWSEVSSDDQKRVGTPSEAIQDGADLLVIGRPIRQAPDPRKAALASLKEIFEAISNH
ncbi:MAG: orotidine-5'-phosphate decarboxylase [Deltaproteobacteria bacterium]|jgi:orotidine-5'-phosphate decarboxylase|nr:orotidine-5'-phosphate decarboxylase [Deltaproteobacteria bacterium]